MFVVLIINEQKIKKSFCWRYNLGNDDIISVNVNTFVELCDHLQVWKRVWILEARSENSVKNDNFLVWNRVRIWRTRLHTPTKNSQEVPRKNRSCTWSKGVFTISALWSHPSDQGMKRHQMFCPIYHARPSQTVNRWLKRKKNKTVNTRHDKRLRFLWRTLSLCPVNEENNAVRVDAWSVDCFCIN